MATLAGPAAAGRKVDEFIVTTRLGDLRFVDREDVPVIDRKEISRKLRGGLDSIPDTPTCKPEEEGIEIAKAFKEFEAELKDGSLTREQMYINIEPRLKAAREREMCFGDFRDHNFLITRVNDTRPLATWTMYFVNDRGVNRSGVQGIECSIMPGLPDPGTPNWFRAFAEILRWFLLNDFVVNGQPRRVLQWTMPPADVGPRWDWASTQSMVDFLEANGVTVTLHRNTPEQDGYGAVLMQTLTRT